jgi:translation elongation factor EF-Tu-like GTPase
MKKDLTKIGIVGHSNIGTSVAAILASSSLSSKEIEIVGMGSEEKERGITINESIERDKQTVFTITNTHLEYTGKLLGEFKTGQELRRERRKLKK